MFSLVSLSKSKFFNRVALMLFVSHSCHICVIRVALVLQMCCLCHTRVVPVTLVLNSCHLHLVLTLYKRLDLGY